MGTKKEDFSENMIDSAVKAFGTVMKKAEERGHQEATKGSGIGALIGGILGSFAGPFGAAGGAALGGFVGFLAGKEKDE